MSASPEQSSSNELQPVVGQRRLFFFNDTGQPAYRTYDLSPDDFLNPQPGDEFFHGELHDRSARILAGMLHHHYRYSPTTSVQIRSKLIWPDSSFAQPAPDVVIVNNLSEPQRQRPILDLAAEQDVAGVEGQIAIRAIFEVTSPLLAEIDLESKRLLYERAKAGEYWIIDSGLRPANNPGISQENYQPNFSIAGYRLETDHFQPIMPTGNLRWESRACRLWLALTAEAPYFRMGDLRTGNALPIPEDDDDPAISAQAEATRRAQSIADQLKL